MKRGGKTDNDHTPNFSPVVQDQQHSTNNNKVVVGGPTSDQPKSFVVYENTAQVVKKLLEPFDVERMSVRSRRSPATSATSASRLGH